jgi:protein-S-isoprenylcysteine O-methyltransferase Ste14
MRTWFDTVLFTIVAPGTVVVLVPALIVGATGGTLRPGVWLAGLLPLAVGAAGYAWCAADFVRRGRGTPAPIAAPEALVVRGLYRYVRNPMYVSVLLTLLGEAFMFASPWLLLYAAVVGLIVHLFVIGYEEPTLRRRFGDAYEDYRRRVPRWLPRAR